MIVERARADIVSESLQATPENKSSSPSNTTSQSSLACLAVESNRVKLISRGAWIVIDPDGITHHAVRLLPKEMFMSIIKNMLPHQCLQDYGWSATY